MSDHCPSCNADLDGGPIPDAIRANYAPPYRWSRKIGLYSLENDRTEAWQCPDCEHVWGRAHSSTDGKSL